MAEKKGVENVEEPTEVGSGSDDLFGDGKTGGEAEEKSEQPVEAKEEKEEPAEEDEEERLEREKALELYKNLQDPQKGYSIFERLAKAYGVDISQTEKKSEARDAKAIFKEKLGKNYPMLADEIAEAVENYVNEAVVSKIESEKQQQMAAKLDEILEGLHGDHGFSGKIAKTVEDKIQDLAEEMPAGPKTNPKLYLSRLYRLALEDLQLKDRKVIDKMSKKVDKINKNEKDAEVASVGRGTKYNGIDTSKPITPRQAVELAMQGIDLSKI